MNALKLTWIRKFKNSNHMWRQIACQVYQNMDDINMYGPSIYSKEKKGKKKNEKKKPHLNCNIFWEDTFKVCELSEYKIKPESSMKALAEPLFLNRRIKIARNCKLFKSWLEKGAYCIGHVREEEGLYYFVCINITNSPPPHTHTKQQYSS